MSRPRLANDANRDGDAAARRELESVAGEIEVFTQADRSMSRPFGGSALGLTISQRLVHHMGSRIEVESMPGQGSSSSSN